MKSSMAIALSLLALSIPGGAASARPAGAPVANPQAVIDLATTKGADLVGAHWHTSPARISIDPAAPAGSAPAPALVSPTPGSADFKPAEWSDLPPEQLSSRQGPGRLSAVWYHTRVTIPPRVGAIDPTGMTAVLCITVDDYAEVWVNGLSPLVLGRTGGTSIAGFNAPNRVTLSRNCTQGESFDIAILGINGPISSPPGNRVWIRSATLDLYAPGTAGNTTAAKLRIDRRDPALDEILAGDAQPERVCTGFQFTEGPLWVPAKVAGAGGQPAESGYLLFSDPNANRVYRWDPSEPGDGVSVFREKSGYAGTDIAQYRQPGSNGLGLDPLGRLLLCEHGRRRVTRLEHNGDVTVLADRFQGKRLNSPNDLVCRSDGTLLFTDPFFGLPKFADDPAREIPVCGVYAVRDGNVARITDEFTGPNGIALSPDERTLYVGNWDERAKIVKAFTLDSDAHASQARVLVDLTKEPGEDAIDGVKVDQRGNVYISGPGGLWIVSDAGKILGLLTFPEQPHNLAWGDADQQTLYLAAQTSIYRLRLKIPGAVSTPAR